MLTWIRNKSGMITLSSLLVMTAGYTLWMWAEWALENYFTQ